MSILTNTPLESIPFATNFTIAASGVWGFGSYVEIFSTTPNPIAIAGFQISGGTYSNLNWELEISTGAVSSEVIVGTIRLYLVNSGNSVGAPVGILLPVPLGIPTGVRVSIRVRSNNANGPGFISFNYYENLSSDQVSTTEILKSVPVGSATVLQVTPNTTPWANSAWLQLIASTPQNIKILGISPYADNVPGTSLGIEYDIGTGGSGSETVLTTLRHTQVSSRFTALWLPAPLPVAAGNRVAIRLRKAGTNANLHTISLIYYEDSATPTFGRISQLPVEVAVLDDSANFLRISQLPVEVALLHDIPVQLRLSQLAVEVMVDPLGIPPSTEQIQFFIFGS